MTLIIGTDEAGYGPNLGPLVVAATAWRVEATPVNAASHLETAVVAAQRDTGAIAPDKTGGLGNRGVVRLTVPLWADSKQIYRAGAGFCALEQGVLVALSLVNPPDAGTPAHAEHAGHAGPVIGSPVNQTNTVPRQWPALEAALGQIGPESADWRTSGLASESGGHSSTTPEWALLPTLCLPQQADAHACCAQAAHMRMILNELGVSLVAVACRAIYPAEFNALLCKGLNKSDILSRTTLTLAASLRKTATDVPALIWCDRHGGRKHYSALVAQHFGATLVQTLAETPARSAYRVPAGKMAVDLAGEAPVDDLDIEFNVGGESRVPVAVASMTAKYVRELAMHAFNAFWASRAPGLSPTAGYPVDAARWRREASDAIGQAGVLDKDLWRNV